LLLIALGWDFGPQVVGAARKLFSAPRQDAWQQVQTGGQIRFGVDSNDWPFAAVDGQGQYVGLNADLGRALGERLGVPVQFVPVGYDGAYDALLLERCDALIGVLENDPARLADFVYTGAYFDAGQVVIGTRMNTEGVDCSGLKSFIRTNPCPNVQGKRIAVELGSEADAAARWLARRTSGVTLIERDSAQQALEALESGEADVAIADAVWARQAVAKHPGLNLVPGSVRPYPLAIAVRADSPRLQTALGRALAQLEAEGALEALIARWLGP
jgi:polar amino acid transport system substrate-binding protein